MKVILASPGGSERNQQQDIICDIYRELEDSVALMTDDIEFIPNLALLSLASYLPPTWDVRFVEEDYIPPEEAQRIYDEHWDLALVSIVNYTARRGYELGDAFRKKGIYTVIGGLHPSALPMEAKEHADTVVIGEGEEIFCRFLDDFIKGAPEKIYKAETPVDLTLIPPPRYDLIPNPTRYNKMPILATRGCPRNCDFCNFPSVYGRIYRHKNISQIIKEIEIIKSIHPEPYLHFCDENLFCDSAFSMELAQTLKEAKVPWECFCDIAVAENEPLLDQLAQSDCRGLLIGLETVDPAVMNSIDPWKHRKLADYRQYIRRIQKRGLPVTGLFILGFDGDDESVFERTRDFIADLRLFDMDFAVLTPIPGSALHQRLKKQGRILSEDWSKYTWTHVNFQPMKLTPEKLQEGLLWLFKEFASGYMLKKRESGRVREITHKPGRNPAGGGNKK